MAAAWITDIKKISSRDNMDHKHHHSLWRQRRPCKFSWRFNPENKPFLILDSLLLLRVRGNMWLCSMSGVRTWKSSRLYTTLSCWYPASITLSVQGRHHSPLLCFPEEWRLQVKGQACGPSSITSLMGGDGTMTVPARQWRAPMPVTAVAALAPLSSATSFCPSPWNHLLKTSSHKTWPFQKLSWDSSHSADSSSNDASPPETFMGLPGSLEQAWGPYGAGGHHQFESPLQSVLTAATEGTEEQTFFPFLLLHQDLAGTALSRSMLTGKRLCCCALSGAPCRGPCHHHLIVYCAWVGQTPAPQCPNGWVQEAVSFIANELITICLWESGPLYRRYRAGAQGSVHRKPSVLGSKSSVGSMWKTSSFLLKTYVF